MNWLCQLAGILASESGDSAIRILLALTIVMGLIQLVFGLLRFGSMVRFISESAITGFVTGVAILMILGQLSKLTGYHGNVPGNTLLL